MIFPPQIRVYGSQDYRGKCPSETTEQVTFFNKIRNEYTSSFGMLAMHPRNEGKRNVYQSMHHKAEGLTKGAADIIIPGAPTFVCELKRRDHTKSKWDEGQIEYLLAAQRGGAFVCVALGFNAAWDAFDHWRLGI